MTVNSDKFQERVKNELEKVYSRTVVGYMVDPRNMGIMDEFNGFSQVTGPCGDTVELWIQVKNDVIREASFLTDGCMTTIAAASMVTELARGRSLYQGQRINQEDLLTALGGLPDGHRHCALLAVNTLKEAINNYITITKEK